MNRGLRQSLVPPNEASPRLNHTYFENLPDAIQEMVAVYGLPQSAGRGEMISGRFGGKANLLAELSETVDEVLKLHQGWTAKVADR